jgi:hypothetical protein
VHPGAIMFSVVFIICVSFFEAAEPEQWSDTSRRHKAARSALVTFGLWREIARSNQRRRRGRGKHERKSVSPDAVTGSTRFAQLQC